MREVREVLPTRSAPQIQDAVAWCHTTEGCLRGILVGDNGNCPGTSRFQLRAAFGAAVLDSDVVETSDNLAACSLGRHIVCILIWSDSDQN